MKTTATILTGVAVGLALVSGPLLADTRYVDINNPTPAVPYTSWSTAANDIQTAVDAAVDGDMVLVADGAYHITSRIRILKGLTVRSENGPENVIVDANGNCRVFTLSSDEGLIALEGLTITGGYADEAVPRGGGIYAYGNSDILITDCVVSDCAAPGNGGGISIFSNTEKSIAATLRNCLIQNNRAGAAGGGVQIGSYGFAQIIITNCSIEDNRSVGNGGGLYAVLHDNADGYVTIEDSIVAENYSDFYGGGIWCTANSGAIDLTRCVIRNNVAAELGGGVRCMQNILLTDSLIAGNEAGQRGGGVHGGEDENSHIVNCTIVKNEAPFGGGTSRSALFNSIVHGNHANTYPDITPNCTAAYTCSPDLTNGVNGNIKSDPQFVDPANGDYRLLATSPCIDAGTNAFVLSVTDLGWNPRIADGDFDGETVVDMGAFEFQVLHVAIDVKPGSDTNPINLKSKGRTPVAILTTDEFDAAEVDPATVRFAGVAPVHMTYEDVDDDGDTDLLLHFNTQELNLTAGSTEAMLIGQTHDGQLIGGVDTIKPVP